MIIITNYVDFVNWLIYSTIMRWKCYSCKDIFISPVKLKLGEN
jgi:hypothetical protein